jgi:hypothetical protein
VIFVYRRHGQWGSVARSRDPGLHGRRPVFRTARALAMSYFDPYIDETGCLTAFAVVDLRKVLGRYDWRLAEHNIWKVEQVLIDYPHRRWRVDRVRVRRLRERFIAFTRAFPDRKPLYFAGRETWTELPREYTRPGYFVDFNG